MALHISERGIRKRRCDVQPQSLGRSTQEKKSAQTTEKGFLPSKGVCTSKPSQLSEDTMTTTCRGYQCGKDLLQPHSGGRSLSLLMAQHRTGKSVPFLRNRNLLPTSRLQARVCPTRAGMNRSLFCIHLESTSYAPRARG